MNRSLFPIFVGDGELFLTPEPTLPVPIIGLCESDVVEDSVAFCRVNVVQVEGTAVVEVVGVEASCPFCLSQSSSSDENQGLWPG